MNNYSQESIGIINDFVVLIRYTGISSHKHRPEWAPSNVEIIGIYTLRKSIVGQLPVHWA